MKDTDEPSRDDLLVRLQEGREEVRMLFRTPAWDMTQAQIDRVDQLNSELNAIGRQLDGEKQNDGL